MVPMPVLGLARFLSLDCQKDPRTQASCSRHLLPPPRLSHCSPVPGGLGAFQRPHNVIICEPLITVQLPQLAAQATLVWGNV